VFRPLRGLDAALSSRPLFLHPHCKATGAGVIWRGWPILQPQHIHASEAHRQANFAWGWCKTAPITGNGGS
jgi:hypothetical protein